MKSRYLEKLISHLDQIDPDSVQSQFLRLAQNQGLMETILHTIQEGVIFIDPEGAIQYANAASERLFGFKFEAASGEPVQKYIKDIDWELILNLDKDEWSKLVRRELEITYPERRFIEFYVSPIAQDELQQEQGLLIILRDITNERIKEVDTLQAEKLNAITLLAAGVAHELGNPLNSLNIHLQLLERELAHISEEDKDILEELVDVAKNEVTRLDQIIQQFLGAIRPSQPNLEKGSIKKLIEESLQVIQQEVKERDIIVELDIPDNLPPINFDRGQIKQALFNLLRNAMQSLSENGIITIRVKEADQYLAIAIQDNGPGISAEVLSHIFEPYYTTKEEGTGLGLMIVQRILRDHGGLIEIDTQTDKGSIITMLLPRDDRRIRLLEAETSKTHE